MTVLAFLPTQTTYVEPAPIQETATTTEEVVVIEDEVKDPEETIAGEACNCYLYAKKRAVGVPRMDDIHPNAEPFVGGLAVEYFKGIKHVSVIKEIRSDGVLVEESNYHHCQTGERFIHFTKPSLVGFWVAG